MNAHKQTPTILCIGKATQDVFLRDEEFDPHIEGKVAYTHLPLGAKLDIAEAHFTTGGNATNVATTFARQGLHSRYLWALGSNDPASLAVMRELDHEGVDTSQVVTSGDMHASYSTILLSPSGERTILNFQGKVPTVKDIEPQLEAIKSADWVYPTALGSLEMLDRIVHEAAKHDVKVMLNPAGSELADPDKLRALLSDIDVLCLNKEEMQMLVEGSDMESLVRHGLNYCPVVIVSDGPNGVCASDGKTIVTAGMYEDVQVLDRTGAGDAFASGFLSQWAQGKSLEESIVFASANSTSVVRVIGAKPGILSIGTELHDMPIQAKAL